MLTAVYHHKDQGFKTTVSNITRWVQGAGDDHYLSAARGSTIGTFKLNSINCLQSSNESKHLSVLHGLICTVGVCPLLREYWGSFPFRAMQTKPHRGWGVGTVPRWQQPARLRAEDSLCPLRVGTVRLASCIKIQAFAAMSIPSDNPQVLC